MTTQLQSAWLVDLHPLPHPPSSDHHLLQVVNSKIRNGLTADFHDFQTAQVFVLTSSDSQVDLELDMKSPDVGLTFVQGEDRIESFYQAKKKLDHFEICEVTVVSDGAFKTFWENVCKLLLTPVHHWGIEALHPPNCVLSSDDDCSSSNIYQVKPESFTGNTVKPTLTSGRNPNMTPSREQTSFDSPGPEENHVENPPFVSDEGTKPVDDSLDIVRDMIQRYLQTLPSLLGVPEVDKAQRFPGKGAGFVHGYSTRRGGVTTMPTLCAMNVLYTDKKRDSPLVVQENLSRLARVGGFNHTNFHIVRVEHGHNVWVVGEEDPPPKYDALITNLRDVTIAAAGADCTPLLFADPVAMVIGAAHAGCKGTVERVAECVVQRMREVYGCRPEDIRVAMGPGVRLGCFTVPAKDREAYTAIHPSCVKDRVEPFNHRIDPDTARQNGMKGSEDCMDIPADCLSQTAGAGGNSRSVATGTFGITSGLRGAAQAGEHMVSDETDGCDAERRKDGNTDISHPAPLLPQTVKSFTQLVQADLKVEQVPTHLLKPKIPRERSTSQERVYPDLPLTNYHVLLQAGVKAEHIDMSTAHCTKCNPDLYFSYERDGFPFGNQIGFVCMPSEVSQD